MMRSKRTRVAPDAFKSPASLCGVEVRDGAQDILGDGGELLHFTEKIVATRSVALWRQFEEQCIKESLTKVEALLEAVKMGVTGITGSPPRKMGACIAWLTTSNDASKSGFTTEGRTDAE